MATGQLDVLLGHDDVALGEHLGLEGRDVGLTTFVVDPGDQVRREVDDLLELLGLELFLRGGAHEEIGEP